MRAGHAAPRAATRQEAIAVRARRFGANVETLDMDAAETMLLEIENLCRLVTAIEAAAASQREDPFALEKPLEARGGVAKCGRRAPHDRSTP
jgi:hypothetical protein